MSHAVQIGLSLVHRWEYAPSNFLIHQGIHSLLESIAAQLSQPGFRALWLVGPEKSGKTHLAVKLFELLRAREVEVSYLVAREFLTSAPRDVPIKQAMIVDEVHEYLKSVGPGESGPFVRAYEEAKARAVSILFLSALPVAELPCDEHVISRLTSGEGFRLGAPEDGELAELVRLMAKQRALKIEERYVNYLVQRVGRDVSRLSKTLDRLMGAGKVNSFKAISEALR